MNRLTIAAFAMTFLAGCSAAAPIATPAPTRESTASPVPTARPTVVPTASAAPTPTPSPTPSPTGPSLLPADAALKPGTYFGDIEGMRITLTIPAAGWYSYSDHCCVIYTENGDNSGALLFLDGDIDSVYAHACHSEGTEIEFGPTVDDLANALRSVKDFEVTGPTEVTLSGFQGKRVGLTVPLDVNVNDPTCDNGEYRLNEGRHYQRAGQTDDNWILDVNGQRYVPTFSTTTQTPADVLQQVEQIRDSLVIEPN